MTIMFYNLKLHEIVYDINKTDVHKFEVLYFITNKRTALTTVTRILSSHPTRKSVPTHKMNVMNELLRL